MQKRNSIDKDNGNGTVGDMTYFHCLNGCAEWTLANQIVRQITPKQMLEKLTLLVNSLSIVRQQRDRLAQIAKDWKIRNAKLSMIVEVS